MITEIWLGVPITPEAQRQRLDEGFQLAPHDRGAQHRLRGVMAHRPHPCIRWTDEQTAVLEYFWGMKSASEIAALIGRTRNAVIGKAHRIGLA